MDDNQVDASQESPEEVSDTEQVKITESLILEEISIDSMCGVY